MPARHACASVCVFSFQCVYYSRAHFSLLLLFFFYIKNGIVGSLCSVYQMDARQRNRKEWARKGEMRTEYLKLDTKHISCFIAFVLPLTEIVGTIRSDFDWQIGTYYFDSFQLNCNLLMSAHRKKLKRSTSIDSQPLYRASFANTFACLDLIIRSNFILHKHHLIRQACMWACVCDDRSQRIKFRSWTRYWLYFLWH